MVSPDLFETQQSTMFESQHIVRSQHSANDLMKQIEELINERKNNDGKLAQYLDKRRVNIANYVEENKQLKSSNEELERKLAEANTIAQQLMNHHKKMYGALKVIVD